jgi:glycosyltransferase involved in cell wall biosynthesis
MPRNGSTHELFRRNYERFLTIYEITASPARSSRIDYETGEKTDMTIAFDVSHIRQRRAGIGRLSMLLLRGLLAADQQREYLLHGWAPDLDEDTLRSFLQPNVRLATARIPGTIKRLYWNVLRTPRLETFIGPFDIFHGAEPLLPPIGNRRSIVTVHDLAYKKFPHFYTALIARKWDILYRRSIQQADAVIVPSENTRNDLMEMINIPSEKIHVVRPPINPLFSKAGLPQAKLEIRTTFSIPGPFILFVGTIEPRKNISRLVKAFEDFSRENSNPVSLVIVGGAGWLYEDIMKTIESSPARKYILLLNYVTDNDLAELYRSAMMFVFPSLYEGHGFPVMEAMVSGVPVITSDNSSLKENGKDVALLVDAESTASITDALQQVYHDESLRSKMSAAGLERAAQYSVKNAVDVILRLYSSLGDRKK